MRAWSGWREWPAAASDLLLGSACWGCERPGRAVCGECRRTLAAAGVFAADPVPRPPDYPMTVAGAAYEGVTGALIRAHKEEQARGVRGVLAERLAAAITAALGQAALATGTEVALVPVPSARATVRSRGDDVTLGLARAAAVVARARGSVLFVAPVLRQRRVVRDQAGLSAAERAANLNGAYAVRRRRPGPALVVDDVTTTGRTLAEAGRALRFAGYQVLGAATVAATELRDRRGLPGR